MPWVLQGHEVDYSGTWRLVYTVYTIRDDPPKEHEDLLITIIKLPLTGADRHVVLDVMDKLITNHLHHEL